MKVSAGVAIFRRIATPDMPALQAHAEMDPAIAGLKAFFAAFGMGLDVFYMIGNVGTSGGHRRLRSRFRVMKRGQ